MSRAGRFGTAALATVTGLVLLAAVLLSVTWLLSDTTTSADTVEGVTQVDVRVGNGDVELIGSDRADVGVELVQADAPLHKPEITVRRDGERLLVVGTCRKRFGPLGFGTCRTDVRLSLPATVTAVVHSQSGTVAATGLRAGTRLTTDNGPVRVAAQSGDLQVSTLDGSVEVRDLSAPTADVRAPDGRIDVIVTTPGPTLALTTDGGRVQVTLPPGGYALDAETGKGRLNLAAGISNDPASSNKLVIRTGGGSFTARVSAVLG